MSASGISTMMMSALKITADRMAEAGVVRPMMFSTFSCGYTVANAAGMMAKYLATSLAMLKVVSAPRVYHQAVVAVALCAGRVAHQQIHIAFCGDIKGVPLRLSLIHILCPAPPRRSGHNL